MGALNHAMYTILINSARVLLVSGGSDQRGDVIPTFTHHKLAGGFTTSHQYRLVLETSPDGIDGARARRRGGLNQNIASAAARTDSFSVFTL